MTNRPLLVTLVALIALVPEAFSQAASPPPATKPDYSQEALIPST
jgi:hypothetical protein